MLTAQAYCAALAQDGSVTWQKQKNLQAPFFALHDLTHFAIETTLGYRRGFFGLIAEGWDIADTTGKGNRGPLPDEAIEVERLVGLVFTERASGAIWSAAEFNEVWQAARRLTDAELLAVRKRRSELFQLWSNVPDGGTLALQYQ